MSRRAMRDRLLAGLLACCLSLPAWAAGQVKFTIVDNLSPGQVEEVITVYIDGRSVGTLHVDAAHPTDRLEITATEAETYDYALCGKLRVQDAGVPEREINDGGKLADVDGRTFAAYTEGGAAFYLVDITPGRAPEPVERDSKARCTAAVASR